MVSCRLYNYSVVLLQCLLAAAAPVENYKPLETDVKGEFKDEINGNNEITLMYMYTHLDNMDESLNEEDNSDDELMDEEEPLEDEGKGTVT